MTLSRVQGVQLHGITGVKRSPSHVCLSNLSEPYPSPVSVVTQVSLQTTRQDGENLMMAEEPDRLLPTLPRYRDMPAPMDHHEKMRLRAAAFRATRVYPGPVGEILSKELLCWEEFGYRFGGQSLIHRLTDEILKTPIAYPSQNPNDYKGGIKAS